MVHIINLYHKEYHTVKSHFKQLLQYNNFYLCPIICFILRSLVYVDIHSFHQTLGSSDYSQLYWLHIALLFHCQSRHPEGLCLGSGSCKSLCLFGRHSHSTDNIIYC